MTGPSDSERALLAALIPRMVDGPVLFTPDGQASGRPWDAPHYLLALSLEGQTLSLSLSLNRSRRLDLRIRGVRGLETAPHAWGSALRVQGPLEITGTETRDPEGLVELAAQVLPGLAAQSTHPYRRAWPGLVLVLPFPVG